MGEYVGQEQLKKYLSTLSLSNCPNSIILRGHEGCGKHVFALEFAKKLGLPARDISEEISWDMISAIYRSATPAVYIIDLAKVNDTKLDVLLKFFEEPLKSIYIICLVNIGEKLPQTILNRGFLFDFEPYSAEDLAKVLPAVTANVPQSWLVSIIRTPGDVYKIRERNIDTATIDNLVERICDKLDIASLPNTLSIAEKINYKDEYDKIDYDFFIRNLSYSLYKRYMSTKESKYLAEADVVKNLVQKSSINHLDKKNALMRTLISLWRIVK